MNMKASFMRLGQYYDQEKLEKLSERVNKMQLLQRWAQLRFRYIVLSAIIIILLWSSCGGDSYDTPTMSNPVQQDRTLVVYSYDEHASHLSKDNILYFLRHGVNPFADYAFVINGAHTLDLETMFTFPPASPVTQRVNEPLSASIELLRTYGGYKSSGNPSEKDKKGKAHNGTFDGRMIQVYQRPSEENKNKKCYRIGSFSDVLMHDDRRLLKSYKRFVFLDSSLRGPFLPPYARVCWQDVYASLLSSSTPKPAVKGSENVKFVGNGLKCNYTAVTAFQAEDEFGDDTSLSLSEAPKHRRSNKKSKDVRYRIATSLFAIDRPALSYLLRHGPLNTCPGSKDALEVAEANIPEILGKAGYGVRTHFDVDYANYCEAEEAVGVGGGVGGDRGVFRTYEQEDGEEERLTGWADMVGVGVCDGRRLKI